MSVSPKERTIDYNVSDVSLLEKIRTLEAQAEWLETVGIETCFDLHGAEPNNAE